MTERDQAGMGSAADQVEALQRWRQFGGVWRLLSETGGSAVVSMCRCDGGEEVQRLAVTHPEVLSWLRQHAPGPGGVSA